MADDTSIPSVPEGLFTKEQYDAAVAQAKSGLADLELEVARLTTDRETIANAQQKAVRERDTALDQLTKLTAELEAAKTAPVVTALALDGVPYVVVRQERMRDLAEAFKARFVDDDDVVLLVKKA